MTKYQQKRAFINKINKRIKTLVSRAGVDIEDIMGKLDGIDGIWFTDTNNLNIDTSYFSPELVKRIEHLVPTWSAAYEREVTDIKSYADKSGLIGPVDLRPNTVNSAIASRFSADAEFDDMINEYYEWADKIDELDLASNPNAVKISDLLPDFGRAWSHGDMAEARALSKQMQEYGINISDLGWNYD